MANFGVGGEDHAAEFLLSPVSEINLTPSFESRRAPGAHVLQFHPSSSSKTTGKPPIAVPAWPQQPKLLIRSGWLYIAAVIFDILTTLLPLIFIVIGVCAAALDNKPTSRWGQRIIEATNIGPTIFPIVFALLVGRFMKNLALFRAERGSNLGLLEQLVGSQSLAGAAERAIMLRRFGVIGSGIVLLWGLSPLGGQSSLRLLSIRESSVMGTQQMRYLSTNQPTTLESLDFYQGVSLPITALYIGSLLSPDRVQLSPLDLWGNVKIPMIETLPGHEDETNPWISLDYSGNVFYSSLIGLMLVGVPATHTANFSIESSYLYLNCSSFIHISNINDTAPYLAGEAFYHNTTSWYGFFSSNPMQGIQTGWNSFWIDGNLSALSNSSNQQQIYYWSEKPNLVNDDNSASLTICNMTNTYVESNVICRNGNCQVDRIRRSSQDPQAKYITPFNRQWPTFELPSFSTMLAAFPTVAGLTPEDGVVSSPTEVWIAGRTSSVFAGVNENPNENWLDISTVPVLTFSHRFSSLLNTFWQATLSPQYTNGNFPADLSLYAAVNVSTAADPSQLFLTNTTIATTSTLEQRYAASALWITLLLLVSLILQLCAIAGLVLKHMTTAPDILGYVSSMTRDNPHVLLPPGGTTLDGLERARLLKEQDVQIADVRWDEKEGHITLRSLNQGSADVGMVSKKRWYL